MTERIRAKVKRVEEFLEKEKERKITEKYKVQQHLISKKVMYSNTRRAKQHAEISFAKRLKQSQNPPIINDLCLINQKSKLTASILRSRYFPQTNRESEIVPGSIVKNIPGFMSQRSFLNSNTARSGCQNNTKHVTFPAKNESLFYCVDKYLNLPECEHCTDLEEMQETQQKQRLLRLSLSQCLGEHVSMQKLEAKAERTYGEIKRKELQGELSSEVGEEMTRLSVLNSTLLNEIDSLKNKEMFGKTYDSYDESEPTAVTTTIRDDIDSKLAVSFDKRSFDSVKNTTTTTINNKVLNFFLTFNNSSAWIKAVRNKRKELLGLKHGQLLKLYNPKLFMEQLTRQK